MSKSLIEQTNAQIMHNKRLLTRAESGIVDGFLAAFHNRETHHKEDGQIHNNVNDVNISEVNDVFELNADNKLNVDDKLKAFAQEDWTKLSTTLQHCFASEDNLKATVQVMIDAGFATKQAKPSNALYKLMVQRNPFGAIHHG